MRYTTAATFVVLTAGFWGLVFWAADAFGTAEIATIVTVTVLLGAVWLWWEVKHAAPDPDEYYLHESYVPDEWAWPQRDDRSEVRHGGLGR